MSTQLKVLSASLIFHQVWNLDFFNVCNIYYSFLRSNLGLVVECQSQRSQILNRTTAIATLRARLFQKELDKQLSSHQSSRKLQVI